MRIFWISLTILTVTTLSTIECANILAIVPLPFTSHQLTYRPIWRGLARRGHNITLITTDPMEPNENITQVDLSYTHELFKRFGVKEMMSKNVDMMSMVKAMIEVFDALYEYQLSHPDVAKILKNPEGFDLLMMEMMPKWSSFSHRMKVPFIGMTSLEASPYLHNLLGNSIHPVIYPMQEMDLIAPLSLTERVMITGVTVLYKLIVDLLQEILSRKLNKQYFGDDCPSGSVMDARASLIFMISNPILVPPRPVTPISVNLEGGLHIEEPKKLPKDIQDYLDQSKQGVIYFSLGSTVDSNSLTPEVIEVFKKTFQALSPLRILWKFANETMPGKPDNVELRKWLPQQDILRHPNIKLFITQGGLQSMEEALEFAVPMLGIPFYGDQLHNVKSMVNKKIGLSLGLASITETILTETIKELLDNPLYKNTIDKYSKIQRDRPMKALDKAIWWTEYVLRHGGTDHLRSPSADIPLYQYFFLDVIAVFIVALLIIAFISVFMFRLFIKTVRFSIRIIFRRGSVEKKEKQQ